MDHVVVDGSNLYNMVAKQLDPIGERAKSYLSHWFDIDRFVMAATRFESPPGMGTVVFHSTNALGRSGSRLSQEESDAFWGRQGRNPDTSTMQVTLPGKQRETTEVTCECGRTHQAETRGEKGVDTTVPRWRPGNPVTWPSPQR